VNIAAHQVDKPYRYGATGPSAFDCSGLTQYSFRAAGKVLPRTVLGQYRGIRHIPMSQVRPGDLVFMRALPSAPARSRARWTDGNVPAQPRPCTERACW